MDDEALLRYSRHIFLDDFDIDGQQALLDGHALVVGAGGLGCPAAIYLATAGFGRITLVDDDVVELSNLQRQIAHGEKDIGKLKVQSLKETLELLNSDCDISVIDQRLSEDSLLKELSGVDVVLDCTDNFASRFVINRACYKSKTPLVSAAAIQSEGQLIVFDFRHEQSPCYQCLYSDAVSAGQPNCSETGVLAPVVGAVGVMQALEAIKLVSCFGELQTKLKVMDFKYNQTRELKLKKDSHCQTCRKTQEI